VATGLVWEGLCVTGRSSIDASRIPRYASTVKSRGVLFGALALGLAGMAFAAASAGVWVIAVAAFALAVWMADLARRDLVP
jgi:hypothetical protein